LFTKDSAPAANPVGFAAQLRVVASLQLSGADGSIRSRGVRV